MTYPNTDDYVRSKTGKSAADITLESIKDGSITAEDIKISAGTLLKQAETAKSANRTQLAANFERAAEMVNIPDEELLEMYNLLRPNRATKTQLLDMAGRLRKKYNAVRCSELVSEAALVYEKRGVLL